MTTIDELRADLGELCVLCNQARRPNVKNYLSAEIRRLETDIKTKVEELSKQKNESESTVGDAAASKPTGLLMKKIASYGWDQSDKFVKIYVTASGVQKLDAGKVTCQFGSRSFHLMIRDLDGSNHSLEITNLHDAILPNDSYHKVKTDTVLIMLKKSSPNKSWKDVVRKLEKPEADYKPATDDDPSAGIMSLMKKMYDEGDDEMKRMINKTWHESQEKQRKGQMDL